MWVRQSRLKVWEILIVIAEAFDSSNSLPVMQQYQRKGEI